MLNHLNKYLKKLVPRGTGNLIMQKKNDNNNNVNVTDDVNSDNDDDDDDDIDNYSGVAISVSFNSKMMNNKELNNYQVVKIIMCHCINLCYTKCDPAPFYLFDEIDSNLDTQYRISARLIHQLSEIMKTTIIMKEEVEGHNLSVLLSDLNYYN